MRILQLCKKFPYPLNDGESIAVTNLGRALAQLGCSISLLSMNTSKDYVDVEKFMGHCDYFDSIDCVFVNNDVTHVGAIKNLFTSDSFHISRFVSKEFKQKLTETLLENKFDVVQLETVYLAPYIDIIRQYSDALIVMRAHNIEHEIWERITLNTMPLHKKLYLKYLTRKLRREELSYLNEYDFLVAISERDLDHYRKLGYVNGATTIPIGIRTKEYKAIEMDEEVKSEHIRPSFIGSLDWAPNIEGLQMFLEKIWPNIYKRFPDMKFQIAGKNALHPERFYKDGVVYHGQVPSAVDFLRKNNILVVPLLSGSGMRAKILEGMALGMTVITTSIGLEGIPAMNRDHVLIADTKEDYINIFSMLYDDPKQIYVIGKRARKFVMDKYDSLLVANQLLNDYKEYFDKKKEEKEVLIQ